MPFKDAWLLVGALLVLVGFAAEPVISANGFVVIIIGVSRVWSRHVFDRWVPHRPGIAFVDECRSRLS
jgi:hypothetical protein